MSGESCPDGTIPIRRITEQDILRVDSINRFGRKDADHSKQEVCIGTNSAFFISIFSISIFWFLFLMIIKVQGINKISKKLIIEIGKKKKIQ